MYFQNPNNMQQSRDCVSFLCNLKNVLFIRSLYKETASYGPDCSACLLSLSISHPGKGSSHWRASLTLDTYFLAQSWAAKMFATAVQIALIKCLALLPSIFTGCVCTISTHQSIAVNRTRIVAHTLCYLKITLHNPEIISAILRL